MPVQEVTAQPLKITKAIKAGAKEVITSKEDFLQYDRFKFGSADIMYDNNHGYAIGRPARVLLDEYTKMLGAREVHTYEDGHTNIYTNVDKLPPWIREGALKDTCHTKPFVVGKDFYYVYDIENWFEWMFLGGAKPLWD